MALSSRDAKLMPPRVSAWGVSPPRSTWAAETVRPFCSRARRRNGHAGKGPLCSAGYDLRADFRPAAHAEQILSTLLGQGSPNRKPTPTATAPPVKLMAPSVGPKPAVAGGGEAQLATAHTLSAAMAVTMRRRIGFPLLFWPPLLLRAFPADGQA